MLDLSTMKLILAPLANISHAGLRLLIHTFADPDEYVTEMIHAPSLLAGGPFEKWYLRTNPVPEKLVWQLTSPTAEDFAKTVPLVVQHGGIGVDLNMGCSAPPIVRQGAGIAWMLKPLTITAEAVRGVRRTLDEYASAQGRPFRLSVKLRLGDTADYAYLLRFCTMLIDEGVELITLHPRTRRQSYARPALHEYTAALARDVPIPVYGNGDICSVEQLDICAHKYPCAGWMIGRAAVQMPWIFKQIYRKHTTEADRQTGALHGTGNYSVEKHDMRSLTEHMITTSSKPPCIDTDTGTANSNTCGTAAHEPYCIDLEKTACLFLHYLTTEQPPEFFLTRAQRFFQFYCRNFLFAHYCTTQLRKAHTYTEMVQTLHTYFKSSPTDKIREI